MTDQRIPLAGVIGSPVAQSRLPRIFGHWLKAMHLPGVYVPMDIVQADLAQVIRTLPKMGFVGVNIAAPYKETVMSIADLITDRATLIGAANTLIFRKDGKIHADNTEGYGFIESIRRAAPDWSARNGTAVVLGAGAAARSVIASLSDAGVPEILLTNRTRVRAEKLKEDFGQRVRVVDWVQAGNAIDGAALVVNATVLGGVGKPELRVPLDGLRPGTVVVDLVYTPLRTHMLQEAEQFGCITVDGLGMTICQAVPAFERWFGERPTMDEPTRAAVLA
ncbi:shikimate dehydrogenase [Seohaeicola zhoushanensis]|uniref:Shikimate dehydrogenase (NADP(+)) n=1 Tax=Seohaeicola zhoushanensis TaxID=1569283 RepID=A0A8J3GTJ1_9RHOB|nr:shikimate dehydrogenase [Seohaeicola zhoushanensis]GHF35356.1 shikimate dehydrogenase (NADP(+)) [Seohaeicola zhoushanensis]